MKNTGDGRRVAKVESEVQRIIAQYVIAQMRGELNGIVTISRVIMPADLRAAKVYVSSIGENSNQAENLKILQSHAKDIQSYISDNLKMRYCPKLSFFKDDVTEHIIKVDKILHDLEEERKVRGSAESSKSQSQTDDSDSE